MKPVNILGFRNTPKATLERRLSILIDNQPLVDWLEKSIPHNKRMNRWREKRDARVVIRNLKRSATHPGTYDLLTCAHCEIPEDILLSPSQVIHEGEYLIWKMKPPGADTYFDDYELLELRFHKPQYEKSISQIIKEHE